MKPRRPRPRVVAVGMKPRCEVCDEKKLGAVRDAIVRILRTLEPEAQRRVLRAAIVLTLPSED